MPTPQPTDDLAGGLTPDAAQSEQDIKIAFNQEPDYSAYIKKAHAWNEFPREPWRIATLVQSNKLYAVLERKELKFDLLDWFEDARVGAVMRGEKIVSESEFWFHLYRRSVIAIQQHFNNLSIHVIDTMPVGKSTIIFGEKTHKKQEKSLPSPIAIKPPLKIKKLAFKPRP